MAVSKRGQGKEPSQMDRGADAEMLSCKSQDVAIFNFGAGIDVPAVQDNACEVVPYVVLMDEASTWTTIFSWLLFWENKEQQVWEISEQNTGT
jgi:hypothetical protein